MPGDAQLVDEAPLQRPIHPLAAAAGLGRVAEDVFDAELRQGSTDLRGLGAIGRAAGDGRMRGPVGAVGVERHRQPPGREHRAQGRHHGGGALARLRELGVEDLRGRILHDGDES